MKMLICQSLHEDNLESLEREIKSNQDVAYFLFPEGYITSEASLTKARKLAKYYQVTIITSLRANRQDKALIINSLGEIAYERLKTPNDETIELSHPTYFYDKRNDYKIGFLLCMEILKGYRDLPKREYDVIVHPIGVGMFSEEQLTLWISEAQKVAKKHETMVVGVSHADGSYKNCGVSIPISYCIDKKGELVYLLKNELQTKMIELTQQAGE